MYIASVFSQLERETIAERIRDNMHELSKTGRWLGGTTPTGYESESIIPETKVEEVTDESGEIVEDEENYGEEEEYSYSDDEIPDDEDGFGTILYESACAFTENGLTFYYVNENGIVEEVTIPFAVVERLAQA